MPGLRPGFGIAAVGGEVRRQAQIDRVVGEHGLQPQQPLLGGPGKGEDHLVHLATTDHGAKGLHRPDARQGAAAPLRVDGLERPVIHQAEHAEAAVLARLHGVREARRLRPVAHQHRALAGAVGGGAKREGGGGPPDQEQGRADREPEQRWSERKRFGRAEGMRREFQRADRRAQAGDEVRGSAPAAEQRGWP